MSAHTAQQILQQDPTKSLYINGEWQSGVNTVANINPSDITDTIGEFAQASGDQVKDAIAAARQAQPKWEATPLEKKQSILQAIGDEMIARCDELGTLLSL
uniref:aldehyde dehydrogenase family protein n=1 Tax=Psychrobacter sp. TaxID=56811 RepID=UPI003564ED61